MVVHRGSSGQIRMTLTANKFCSLSNKIGLHMRNLLNRFAKDESGATAIEYGLIAALIAVAIIGTVGALGSKISDKFQEVTTAMK